MKCVAFYIMFYMFFKSSLWFSCLFYKMRAVLGFNNKVDSLYYYYYYFINNSNYGTALYILCTCLYVYLICKNKHGLYTKFDILLNFVDHFSVAF